MQNHSYPFNFGALAMTVLLATTLQASAQDATDETPTCDNCVVEASGFGDESYDPKEDPDTYIYADEGSIDPDLMVYPSEAPELAFEDTYAEETEIVMIDGDGSEPELLDLTLQIEGTVEPVEYTIDANIMVDDGGDLSLSPEVMPVEASMALPASAEFNAAPEAAQKRSNVRARELRHRAAASTKGNACLDSRTYLAIFCAWQGYERPVN